MTTATRWPRAVWLPALAGTALHLYVAVFRADTTAGSVSFLLGWLAYSVAPYAVAITLARVGVAWPAMTGYALAALAGDVYMHHAVFIVPRGSTAALGLLFMPAINLVALGPAGALAGWLAGRWAITR